MPNPTPNYSTRFQKGKSGNPAGKPKGARSFTTQVREALLKIAETKDGKKITYEQALVQRVLQKAISEGNEAMIRLMWNYLDGMPAQSVDHTTAGQPIINISKEIAKRYDVAHDAEDSGK